VNKPVPRRRSIRLPDYDYAQAGAYFVTVVTQGRECLFGEVADDIMVPNALGRVVEEVWASVEGHFLGVQTDAFIIMPNHIHAIVVLTGATPEGAETAPIRDGLDATDPSVGARSPRPPSPGPLTAPPRTGRPVSPTLGQVVAYLKYQSTKHINTLLGADPRRLWQRGYYERVIRNQKEYDAICRYLYDNPTHWAADRENPDAVLTAETP